MGTQFLIMATNLVPPTFFPSRFLFRKWMKKNHSKEKELLVGFYKTNSKKKSITWGESVDEALCFGWIDGIRKSIDAESYCIRFTPRKSTSIWSAINIKKVEEFTQKGLMHPAELVAFSKRKENKINQEFILMKKRRPFYLTIFKKNLKQIKRHGNIFNQWHFLIREPQFIELWMQNRKLQKLKGLMD